MVRLALFLASARDKDTNETIETAAKIANAIDLLFGVAVVVGVAAEYILPATGYLPIGNWPGAAVALGVAGEIVFARRGSHLEGVASDRLRLRLAEAEERLAKFAWRNLDDKQKSTLVECLKGSPWCVSISYISSDVESANFVGIIGHAFKEAGWDVNFIAGMYGGGAYFGITLPSPASPDWSRNSEFLLSAFHRAGIAVGIVPEFPRWAMATGYRADPWQDRAPSIDDATPIFVGPKHVIDV